MNNRGQPKIFSEEEFEQLVFEYLDLIYKKQNENIKDIPTFYGFYLFVNEKKQCSYHTIRRCFDEYWADIKKDFQEIRTDIIARGATVGVYNSTMSIFGLKNWCGWSDNPKSIYENPENKEDDPLTKALKEEAERMQNEAD